MTQPLRDTRYARELATAKLPSGPGGNSFVAIERIFVKQAEQVEIRFSWWEKPNDAAATRLAGG
jgi:hypothetical protein